MLQSEYQPVHRRNPHRPGVLRFVFIVLLSYSRGVGRILTLPPGFESEEGIGFSSEQQSKPSNERKRMKLEQTGVPSLRELELEAEVEAREFARVRLQQRLQEIADQHGEIFPPQPTTAGASAHPPDATAHRRRRH